MSFLRSFIVFHRDVLDEVAVLVLDEIAMLVGMNLNVIALIFGELD